MTWSHQTEGDSLRASLFLCCIHLQWISRSLQYHLLHFFLFTAYKTSEEKKEKHEMKKQNKKHKPKKPENYKKYCTPQAEEDAENWSCHLDFFCFVPFLFLIFFQVRCFFSYSAGFLAKKNIYILHILYIYIYLGWVRERFLGKWRPLARTQKDSLKFRRLLSEFWTGKTKKYSGRAGPNPLPLLPQGLQTCFWLFIVCRGSVVS